MRPSLLPLIVLAALCATCGPDRGPLPDARPARDAAPPGPDAAAWIECNAGQSRCFGEVYQRCVLPPGREMPEVQSDDCAARGQACVAEMGGCVTCRPGALRCSADDDAVERCEPDARTFTRVEECDVASGVVCRGERCRSLCDAADVAGSNVGCEYYAVDLDNAVLSAGETAASQQFAVVVSNPDPRLSARVRIERNNALPGEPVRTTMVASAVIPPMDLEVFPLQAREVDCSAPGTFNTGTGTCLSSAAYRISSTTPVIAAQFNPLENVLVFSNDASLLIPTNSLQGDYVAMGWPMTIASAPYEITLNPTNPADLRPFLTVVGVAPNTHVRVVPRTDVLPGGPLTRRGLAGEPIEATLGPFDVLNLEADAFLSDFTGSTILADGPVAVFSGSECSDVPAWTTLNDRACCCDHLEHQLFPRTTLGTRYVAVHTPRRTPAVRNAGGMVALVANEPEYFKVLATEPGETSVRTTLPSTLDDPDSAPLSFTLRGGESRTLRAYGSFEITASQAVSVANMMSSQLNTGIPLDYPGGDPSFIPIPPVEQWRETYVFLTPNRYAFDFVSVVAPTDATVELDDTPLPGRDCTVERADACVERTGRPPCPPPRYTVYQCQLSYPEVSNDVPYPLNVSPGRQRDGVHVIRASEPVSAIVSGFDLRVSYGYPAGTQLRPLQ